jgi:hypothetical protein
MASKKEAASKELGIGRYSLGKRCRGTWPDGRRCDEPLRNCNSTGVCQHHRHQAQVRWRVCLGRSVPGHRVWIRILS